MKKPMSKVILMLEVETPEDYMEYIEGIRKKVPGIVQTCLEPIDAHIKIESTYSNGSSSESYF